MTNSRANPYPGPRSFVRGEKLYGRQRETAELLDLLIAERIVLLYSPSGAGKTSLVQAALIPELEAEGFRVLPVMRPGLLPEDAAQLGELRYNRYVLSLLLGLERDLPEGEQTDLAELAKLTMEDYLGAKLPAPEGEAWHGDVLIFDQFEEVLTVDPTDREAKLAFFEQVGQALRDRDRWALFSMREEYVAWLDPFVRPIPARFDKGRRYRLELLGPDSAREAMQGPPADQDPPTAFTDAAANKLADDLRQTQVQQADGSMKPELGQVIEPVHLQVVCRQIWDRLAADDYEIGLDDVENVGDVDQALRDYYAGTVARVAEKTEVGERAIREWFDGQLITEGGIRAQVLRGQERSPEGKEGLANAAIRPLVDAYLVRAELRRGATWYELAHDRLIGPVREDNVAWFAANLSTLQRQAVLWEAQGKPDGLLLSGEALAEAEAWAAVHAGAVEARETELLAESRKARERDEWDREQLEKERRQSRIIRVAGAVATALAVLAVIAAVFGFTGRRQAIISADEASIQRNVALAASTAEAQQKSVAEAASTAAVEERNNAFAAATRAIEAKAIADAEKQRADEQKKIADDRAAEAQRQSLISRSRQLATQATSELGKDERETALLLAIESGRVADTLESFAAVRAAIAFPWYNSKALYGHAGFDSDVTDLKWSKDESKVLTSGADGTVRIWDAASGAELLKLQGHQDRVYEATWNADGSKILTASADDTARVWDAATGKELLKLASREGAVREATWNADGSRILTDGDDGTVRVWDAATGIELARLGNEEDRVSDPKWSADGSKILAISTDGTVRVWDPASRAEPLKLDGYEGPVSQAIWNASGSRVLTAGDDGTARIWDAATGDELVKMEGHTDRVSAARWSGDESVVLTSSDDDTVRSWDAASGSELARLGSDSDPVYEATWNADGTRVLAFTKGGALVGDAKTLTGLVALEGWPGGIWRTTWSTDGSKILTQESTGTVIWDASSGTEESTLVSQPGGGPYAAAWSADGSKLLLAGDDGTVRIWRAGSGGEMAVLKGLTDEYSKVTWSEDSEKVLILSDDRTVSIWDATSGTGLANLGRAAEATWNRDESKVLTNATFGDGPAFIRDATSGKMLAKLGSDEDIVHEATWNADGSMVLTHFADEPVRIWDGASGRELTKLGDGRYPIREAAWSRDGSMVLTSGDGIARVWDAANGNELVTLGSLDDPVEAVWSGDGSKVLTAGGGMIRSWDPRTRAELTRLAGDTLWSYNQWAADYTKLSPDESRILWFDTTNARGGGQWLRIWDALNGAKLADFTESIHGTSFDTTGARSTVYDYDIHDTLAHAYDTYDTLAEAMWSQDGSKILTRSDSGIVHIWDVATGSEPLLLRDLTPEPGANDAMWNEDGSEVLTADRDGAARIWDVASGTERMRLEGHTGQVLKAMWSGDGSKVLTAGADGTARVWDAATGAELARLEGHTGEVTEAMWSEDGGSVLTRGADGTVRIWYANISDLLEAACDRAPRNLRWDEWNRYMEGDYRPTCAEAPIPPDVVTGIQGQAMTDLLAGEPEKAIAALVQLNGWLRENGQFRAFGVEPKAFLAPVLVDHAPRLAEEGKIPEAVAALSQAATYDPSVVIEFRTWNDLCRYGALWQRAVLVMDACERAGALAEAEWELREMHDSRGLARAMTGDVTGAIDDFEVYVAHLKESSSSLSETEVEQREAWIAALKAGQNPFDDAVLKALREE